MTEEEVAALAEAAANILVVNDLLDDVIKDAEAHTAIQAVFMYDTIGQVIRKAREAQAALETHLMDVLEVGEKGDIEYRGQSFGKRKKKVQERFDHREIGKSVHKRVDRLVIDQYEGAAALIYQNGVHDGAGEAIRIMSEIYLSDSTKAKIGELERYGIPCKTNADGSVRTAKSSGYELKVIPLMKGDQ